MPLLQGQPFKLVAIPNNITPSTEIYTIPHTGEQFINKSDYEDRLALYSQNVWSCQCTGRNGLSHQEAWTSEAKVRVLLQTAVPEPFCGPVLSLVQHSTAPLEQLVESASVAVHSLFHPGEELDYRPIDAVAKTKPVKVCVVSSRTIPIPDKDGSMSSSDMSNTAENSGSVVTNGCFHSEEELSATNGSEANGTGEGSRTQKMTGKPKSASKLRHDVLYDVKRLDEEGQGRIIPDVSASCLQRKGKPPGKDNLRLFIRANAVRPKCTTLGPWLVSEDAARQYNVLNRLAPIFTASAGTKRKATSVGDNMKPAKAAKMTHNSMSEEELEDDRPVYVSSNSEEGSPPSEASESSRPEMYENGASPVSQHPQLIAGHASQVPRTVPAPVAEDDIQYVGSVSGPSPAMSRQQETIIPDLTRFNIPHEAQLFPLTPNNFSPFLSQFSPQVPHLPHILNTPQLSRALLASHINSALYQTLAAQNRSFASSHESTPNTSHLLQSMSFNSSQSLINSFNSPTTPNTRVPKRRGRPPLTEADKARKRTLQKQLAEVFINLGVTSSPNRPPSPHNSSSAKVPSSPTKTLTCPPSVVKSPQKRVHTSETVMKLPLVRRLLFEHKNRKNGKGFARKVVYTMDHAVTRLSLAQINLITDESLKDALMVRHGRMLEKKMLQGMTPEAREAYNKEKAKEVATKRRREKQALNRKCEDQTIEDLTPLPEPTPVPTIDGAPDTAFSDIAMMAEFLDSFGEVFNISSSKKSPFATKKILKAILSGKKGYAFISSLLCTMLPTVLYDSANTHYKELGIPLREMPISYQTAPELARLCLKHQKQDEIIIEETSEDGEPLVLGEEEDELSEDLLEKLSAVELWELSSGELVAFLTALTHRCMASDTLGAHVDKMEDIATKIYKERANLKKERLREDFEVKQKRKEERKARKKEKKPPGRPKGYSPKLGMTIADFYECKIQGKEVSPRKEILLQNRQKRKSTLEKLEDDKKEQELREAEKAKLLREERYRECEEILQNRRNTLRASPLGTDRHHNRYWLFHTSTPGLYVEKCWLHDHAEYSVEAPEGQSLSDGDFNCASLCSTSLKEEEEEDCPDSAHGSDNEEARTPTKGRPRAVAFMDYENLTYPPVGKNAWFVYNTEDEVNQLILALSDKGIREHHLKHNIMKAREKISRSLASLATENYVKISKLKAESSIVKEEGKSDDESRSKISKITKEQDSIEGEGGLSKDLKEEVPVVNDDGAEKAIKIEEQEDAEEDEKQGLDCCFEMVSSLKEDICQIERELIEGWLGAVDNYDAWEKVVLESSDVTVLGQQLVEAQRCMMLKNLKGFMAPLRKPLPPVVPVPQEESQETKEPATPQQPQPEYIEVESTGVLKWREAVAACQTYSRLHVLVGMFDSCIKWEKSLATKKCTVCRSKDREDPLILCEKCEKSYHWRCLRPKLTGDPPALWYCAACLVLPRSPTRTRQGGRGEAEAEEEGSSRSSKSRGNKTLYIEPPPPDPECKVCSGRLGLIFCSVCNAPYHSECHQPPPLTRARKDWKCCDCEGSPEKAKPVRETPLALPPRNNESHEDAEARQEAAERRRQQTLSKPRSSTGQFLSKATLAAMARRREQMISEAAASKTGSRQSSGPNYRDLSDADIEKEAVKEEQQQAHEQNGGFDRGSEEEREQNGSEEEGSDGEEGGIEEEEEEHYSDNGVEAEEDENDDECNEDNGDNEGDNGDNDEDNGENDEENGENDEDNGDNDEDNGDNYEDNGDNDGDNGDNDEDNENNDEDNEDNDEDNEDNDEDNGENDEDNEDNDEGDEEQEEEEENASSASGGEEDE